MVIRALSILLKALTSSQAPSVSECHPVVDVHGNQ